MKNTLLLAAMLLICSMSSSQQLPVFSHYMFNRVALNPAVAGMYPYMDFKLNHRSQWVGFDDTPVTQVLSGHGILPNGNMGVGGYLFNDAAGPFRRIGLNLAYAYHLQFGKMNLSMGLSGGFLQYSVDGTKITLYDATDNAVDLTTRDRDMAPDANFGMLLYNDNLHVGFSALHLLPGKLEFFGSGGIAGAIPLEHHYYAMGGYRFTVKEKFHLDPSFLVNIVQANPTQVHANLTADYQEKIYAGFSYRTGDAVVALAGAKFRENIFVAYSYDILFSGLQNTNSGSHEITIGYSLSYKSGEGPLKRRYKLNRVRVE